MLFRSVEFDFNVAAQGENRDEVVPQGSYYLYAVAADEDTFTVGVSTNVLAVRHSPAFEFTAPLVGLTLPIDPSQQDRYTIEWQRGRSDKDLDGNAIISLYYTGVDPQSVNYSGTDSTQLLATSGTRTWPAKTGSSLPWRQHRQREELLRPPHRSKVLAGT